MTGAGFRRNRRLGRNGPVVVVDVGTSKVVCLIATPDDGGQDPHVIGVGHQLSRGLKAGTIIDMDAAQAAIAGAVQQAEEQAGDPVHKVIVNVSCGKPRSQMVPATVDISGEGVLEDDLDALLYAAQPNPTHNGAGTIIHTQAVNYTLDGNRGIRDPRGMAGHRLAAEVHVITAAQSGLSTLVSCLERSHLGVESFVVSPYASGVACLVEDEMELGALVIDMGGGTTSLAVFAEGHMVYADAVPVGGLAVTNDIARGLTTPVAVAERLKTLHGNAMVSTTDDREVLDVPQVGESDVTMGNQVPRSLLVGIIQPRLKEIFELVRARLEDSGFGRVAGRRVVLTGGASQLAGTRELAQSILDKQVRLGKPRNLGALGDGVGGAAFATAAGLLTLATSRRGLETTPLRVSPQAPKGFLDGIYQWLMENL